MLSVGGTAGQVVVVTTLHKSDEQVKLEVDSCNLVADKDGFAWKGHEALDFKPKNNPTEQSLTVTALLQIQPPAAVTALALEAPSGVVAVGTAHGVLLYDFFRRKVVMTKSTLNPNGTLLMLLLPRTRTPFSILFPLSGYRYNGSRGHSDFEEEVHQEVTPRVIPPSAERKVPKSTRTLTAPQKPEHGHDPESERSWGREADGKSHRSPVHRRRHVIHGPHRLIRKNIHRQS